MYSVQKTRYRALDDQVRPVIPHIEKGPASDKKGSLLYRERVLVVELELVEDPRMRFEELCQLCVEFWKACQYRKRGAADRRKGYDMVENDVERRMAKV